MIAMISPVCFNVCTFCTSFQMEGNEEVCLLGFLPFVRRVSSSYKYVALEYENKNIFISLFVNYNLLYYIAYVYCIIIHVNNY